MKYYLIPIIALLFGVVIFSGCVSTNDDASNVCTFNGLSMSLAEAKTIATGECGVIKEGGVCEEGYWSLAFDKNDGYKKNGCIQECFVNISDKTAKYKGYCLGSN
jgi:hypothetical protein